MDNSFSMENEGYRSLLFDPFGAGIFFGDAVRGRACGLPAVIEGFAPAGGACLAGVRPPWGRRHRGVLWRTSLCLSEQGIWALRGWCAAGGLHLLGMLNFFKIGRDERFMYLPEGAQGGSAELSPAGAAV